MTCDEFEENFTIGDLIQVREWDDMVDEFGVSSSGIDNKDISEYFSVNWDYLCGNEFKITDIVKKSSEKIDIYLMGVDAPSNVSPWMLEHCSKINSNLNWEDYIFKGVSDDV